MAVNETLVGELVGGPHDGHRFSDAPPHLDEVVYNDVRVLPAEPGDGGSNEARTVGERLKAGEEVPVSELGDAWQAPPPTELVRSFYEYSRTYAGVRRYQYQGQAPSASDAATPGVVGVDFPELPDVVEPPD